MVPVRCVQVSDVDPLSYWSNCPQSAVGLYMKYSSSLKKQSEGASVLLPIQKMAGIEALFKKTAYKALVQQGL